MSEVTDHDNQFEATDAGASETYPMQCSALRKNGYVMIKQRPCKIVDMSTSKTGKHGHAKVHLVAIDIFTGKKLEELCPSTHNMEVPIVKRSEWQLVNIDDDEYMGLIDDSGASKDDLKIPDGDVGVKIRTMWEEEKDVIVVIQKAVNEEIAIDAKEAPRGSI
ncbi:Eukaryotic translation initiation factor 5A-1 [Ceratocystis fimbriata CBS 114723]|uniref:Eukaryotic translation initiation factor 5A n=1 Tax=Ceratocystis fimbriata CBS 114723 TaxID=1035309 RepID=A0A2C5WUX6_9PEZI|nr:Eukaryotic translation initiation factor 5A-1 [Ceratocystis fimbriata CBS 114723]